MKNILLLLTVFTIILSCQKTAVKTASLENLNNKKTTLTNKIDSLNKELKTIEIELAKLDTSKKLQIVTTIPVKNQVFKHFIEIQGVVKADKNIEIRPELGGTVKAIFVKEGEKVKAGQTLIQLDDISLINNINELKTQLSLATTTFERQQRLWNQKIGSEMQYLQAKAQKESIQNSITTLKAQAHKMKIIAPFSGIVDEVFPKKGELTNPQFAVVRLINLDNVYIEADVTETFLPVIKVGTETMVHFSSINKNITSEISHVGNYINPDNRSFKTKINLSNKDQTIKPNLLADLKILDFKQEGIIIPANLVQQDQNGENFVYAIQKENTETIVKKKPVQISKEYNLEVYINSGLAENDILVNSGARLVKNGDAVKIKNN